MFRKIKETRRILKGIPTKTWRPTEEDVKLLDELRGLVGKRYGLELNNTDVVRMGLRKLAEAEGLR